MKRRIDPVIGVISVFALLFVTGLIVLVSTVSTKERAFADACIIMGGVPLIGHDGTKVCFKTDVILSVN